MCHTAPVQVKGHLCEVSSFLPHGSGELNLGHQACLYPLSHLTAILDLFPGSPWGFKWNLENIFSLENILKIITNMSSAGDSSAHL